MARALWAALVVGLVGLFVIAIPVRFSQLRHAGIQAEQTLRQPALAGMPALLKVVLSASVYPVATLALEIGLMVAFALAAVAIFWRRSDDRMALFVSITLVSFGAMTAPALDALAAAQPLWQTPVSVAQGIGLECVLLIFYLSPTGRFVPGWTRLLAIIWTVWRVAVVIFPAARFKFFNPQAAAATPGPTLVFWFLLWVWWIGTALVAQVYRYRQVSTPEQRQQTKWALIGATAGAVGYVAFVLPRLIVPALQRPGLPHLLYILVGTPLYLACLVVVPVCIAFSILRYRLWDVDILISRALVATLLTVILGLVYFTSVVLFEGLFRALSGQGSDAAVVLSTLAIAALFQPLRHRIQRSINRRFYRSRYDAARTLEQFAASLRHEVDLAQMTGAFIAVVEKTMRPAHVSLWLRDPGVAAREKENQP